MQLDRRPLAVGDKIHGYCGGYFGRDHYDCGTVEAVSHDWMVARSAKNGSAFSATGEGILTELAEYAGEECTFYSEPEMCDFWTYDD